MSFSAGEQITIPSPIDVHTHLREPGGELQETIATGSLAALKGGYQMVSDMPNNAAPYQTWSRDRVLDKAGRIERTAYTDAGVYSGVDFMGPAFGEIPYLIPRVLGTKFYMGQTTNNRLVLGLDDVRPYADAWIQRCRDAGKIRPILLHAEGEIGSETAEYIAWRQHPVHWCHVSTRREAYLAHKLRATYPDLFTAGVTPHHLTMTATNTLQQGWYGARQMPALGKEFDREALMYYYNLGDLHILETDHAPHIEAVKTAAENDNPRGETGEGCTTCYGVSGIEHVLGVMATQVRHGATTMERVVDSLYEQPLRMLRLGKLRSGVLNATTTIEFGARRVREADVVGKSTNTPYLGWAASAKVVSVQRNGKTLYDEHTEPTQGYARFIHQDMEEAL